MRLQVMTPEKTFFSGEASNLVINAEKGQLTILDKHADLITLVKPGLLQIKTTQSTLKFEISDGVLRVDENRCAVLAGSVKSV
jgi:F-type H+-transporting ATPase subunit epsilon